MARRTTNGRQEIFRITESNAQRVQLAGDFTKWEQRAIPMQTGPGGIWTATMILPAGTHQYLFMADGKWREDPECTLRVPNPYGGHSMGRQVA